MGFAYRHILIHYLLFSSYWTYIIRFGLKEEEMEHILRNKEFEDFNTGCLAEPKCPEPDTYRTIDGSCNHRDQLRNLGRAASGYRRLLSPAYDDGYLLFLSQIFFYGSDNQ